VVTSEWRAKTKSPRCRATWSWPNTIGSFGAPLLWGIGLANLLGGVPIDSEGHYAGTFWDLFSPYTVVAGIAVVALFAFHGATFLTLRTIGDLHDRAERAALRLAIHAGALRPVYVVWTVAMAMDRNDKDLFPPALPAAVAIVALALAVVSILRGRSGRRITMHGL